MSAVAEREAPASTGVRYIALAGNPNCGKTTLFNALTGLRHRVGNYAGVTVERKEGRVSGTGLTLLDLPGTYSLNARSPDEAVARDVLIGRLPPVPELVAVVVDASNLERNLYLATQVMDLGLPVVLCLNMVDVAEQMGLDVDAARLERELGIPVVPTVASKGQGLDRLKGYLNGEPPPPPERHWQVPAELRRPIADLTIALADARLCQPEGAFFLALQLLSHSTLDEALRSDQAVESGEVRRILADAYADFERDGFDAQSAPVEARYDWINQVCAVSTHQREAPVTWSDRFDRIATHKVWGFVLFFVLMALMFQAIFAWAHYPMDLIANGQKWLGDQVAPRLPEGDLRSLVVDGVIAGVGGVIVFMPQILFLFFFLGLLEDTGYMARAAFVMDRVMGKVGLHGKSFIPLLSSFACAIPGIMATRTIENRRDRMVTILVAPLMSCSARLPVYTLLIGGFIAGTTWGLSNAALTLVSMYLLGLFAALGMAALFKKTLFKGEAPLFLMELPPYKFPSPKTVLLQTWERASEFLKRAGTVILAINLLMWGTMRYPGSAAQPSAERLRGSVAGTIGRAIEPTLRPFGMDWKVGIGILGSFAAREVFVSTMATVYSVENSDKDTQLKSVQEQLRDEKDALTGKPRFTPASAAALMVFYVLAMQCVSTMAVVRRETNSWKWPLFQWAYMTGMAWVAAVIVFQVGRLLGLG